MTAGEIIALILVIIIGVVLLGMYLFVIIDYLCDPLNPRKIEKERQKVIELTILARIELYQWKIQQRLKELKDKEEAK